jgi:hypothetical protein
MDNIMIKINWIYEGEAAYWHSSEHRFSVFPCGWRGGVTPDYYKLRDNMSKNHSEQPCTYQYDTVRESKAKALRIIMQQEEKEYG